MSHQQWRDWVSPDIDYIKVCPDFPTTPQVKQRGLTARTRTVVHDSRIKRRSSFLPGVAARSSQP